MIFDRRKRLDEDRDIIKRKVAKLGADLGLLRIGDGYSYPTAKKKVTAFWKLFASESHLRQLHPINNVSDEVQEKYSNWWMRFCIHGLKRLRIGCFVIIVGFMGLHCSFSLSFAEYYLFRGQDCRNIQ